MVVTSQSHKGDDKASTRPRTPIRKCIAFIFSSITDLLNIEGQFWALRSIFTILSPPFLILAPAGHRVTRGWHGARIVSLRRRAQRLPTGSLRL